MPPDSATLHPGYKSTNLIVFAIIQPIATNYTKWASSMLSPQGGVAILAKNPFMWEY